MKIYFDTDLYGECLSRCPMGRDCMVGSVFCEQCKYNMYTRTNTGELAVFSVGNKHSCREADYVECSFEGDVTFWKLIKKFFYKYIK